MVHKFFEKVNDLVRTMIMKVWNAVIAICANGSKNMLEEWE